ncbi:hypothetical protein GCM10023189_41640 [Nibrella saemangeumensis]|uniref:Por secretion system C-terminal sorting domain-containing protein n=2 Tax=Nibrella saemangeumensis TaxID=1084526 RepID=A0ABP8NCF4_9BACT
MIVTWDAVGYYEVKGDKVNTFQIIISNGADPIIGIGNNVAFYYDDMQWTTGDASGGAGGFEGSPATVGVNKGDGVNYIQVGRFNVPGSAYDGPGGANDGVDYLDGKCFSFNVSSAENIPPIASNLPANNTINLQVGEAASYTIEFIGPEVGQSVTTDVNTSGLCNTTASVTNGVISTVNLQLTAAECNIGSSTITLTATDDGSPVKTTIITLQVNITGGCNSVGGTATATSSSVCSGFGTTIDLTGQAGNIQWQMSTDNISWTDIPGETSATLNTGNLTTTTYYQAKLTESGCDPAYSSVATVSVTPAPVGGTAIAASASVCSGSGTTISLTGQIGNIQWQKSTDNSTWTDIPEETGTTLNTGNLTVKTYFQAKLTNSDCDPAYSSVATVDINQLPLVTISTATTVVLALQNVALTSSAGASYQWSTGATTQTTVINPPLGTTPYSVTVTDVNGCSNSGTIQILGYVIVAGLNVEGPINICVKTAPPTQTTLTLPITMTVTNGAAPYTYTWSYKAPNSTSYKPIGTNAVKIGQVTFKPVANSPTLEITGTKGNFNGLQGYLVQLTVTDVNGLTGSAQTLLDGSCSLSNARQGTISAEMVQVQVYPNPVTEFIQIEIQGLSVPAKVRLYDLQGRMRGNWSIEPEDGTGHLKAGISELPEGIYLISIETSEGVLFRQRVLKQL